MTRLKWSDIAGPKQNGTTLNWSDITAPDEASRPHPPIYDEQNRPIDQSQVYAQHRQEPYPGMPLEQAWASDPISQGLGTVLENPDVRTGLMVFGAQPELAALPEVAAGVQTAGSVPRVAAKIAPLQTEAERTAAIKAEAGAGLQAAKDIAPPIPASEVQGLLDKIKTDTKPFYNEFNHTAATGFFKKFEAMLPKEEAAKAAPFLKTTKLGPVSGKEHATLQERIAKADLEQNPQMAAAAAEPTITLDELHNARQSLSDVHGHANANQYEREHKVASVAKEDMDEFFLEKAGPTWTQNMKDYALATTAEDIKNLVERALYRTSNLSAGQKAARLNTELRQWARPKISGGPNARMRMLRGVSPQAADMMEKLATAQIPNSTLLKIIGTAAPTGIAPVAFDEIAGQLFTSVLGIHVNPLLLMGAGIIAKHKAGERVEAGINDIIRVLNSQSSLGPRVENLQKTLGGPSIFQKLMERPRTAQAIRNWANATGPNRKAATLALTTAIAKETARPDLQQRIQQELDNIDHERETVMPKTQQAMQ